MYVQGWIAALLLLSPQLSVNSKIDSLPQRRKSVGIDANAGAEALERLRQVRVRTTGGGGDPEDAGQSRAKGKAKKPVVNKAVPDAKAGREDVSAPVEPVVLPNQTNKERRTPAGTNIDDSKTKLDAILSRHQTESSAADISSSATISTMRQSCFPCSSKDDHSSAAIRLFWLNDLIGANGCACSAMKQKDDNRLSRISRSVYVATLKYTRSQDSANGVDLPDIDMPSFTAAGPPAIISHWEVLAPFPCGLQELDGDPVIPYLFRVRDTLQDMLRDNAHLDMFWSMLTTPTDVLFPSELAEDGHIQWVAALVDPDSGLVDVNFPFIRWSDLVQSLSTTGVLQFQGWARGVTFVSRSGPHILSCKGVGIVYVRNDNFTRIVSADPAMKRTGYSYFNTIDLKVGPVGLLLPIRGSVSTQFSCTLRERSDIAEDHNAADPVDGTKGATAKKLSVEAATQVPGTDKKSPTHGLTESKKLDTTRSRAGSGKSFALIVQRPQYLSDMLLDYPISPPHEAITEPGGLPHRITWGNISKSNSARVNAGKGLLLSGYFSLPIMNAEARSVTVRFELDGQQHLLHNFSVRVVQPSPKRSRGYSGQYWSVDESSEDDSEVSAKSERHERRHIIGDTRSRGAPSYDPMVENYGMFDDATVNLPSGQSSVVPLELFVPGGYDEEIFIACKKRTDGKLFGFLTLSVIPSGSPKISVPLIFRCRRLDESISFSFLTDEHSVADAVAVAPIFHLVGLEQEGETPPKTLPSESSKLSGKVMSPVRDTSDIVSVRGKGVSARGTGASRARRDATNRASDATKRYEALRSADSSQFSSSTAARLLAERENTADSNIFRSSETDGRTMDIEDGTAYEPRKAESDVALDPDASKIKSQFYIHKLESGSSIQLFFQFTCSPAVSHFMHESRTTGVFPLLITLHGTASSPEDQAESYRVLGKSSSYATNKGDATRSSRLGVDGYWVLAPRAITTSAVVSWEGTSLRRIDAAAAALKRMTQRLKKLPGLYTHVGRVLTGHGTGAHGAIVAAFNRPDTVSCLAPIALSYLRKENTADMFSIHSFFGVDAAHTDPAHSALMTRPLSEFHIDRHTQNGIDMKMIIRVGARDAVSNSWVSKRFYRLARESRSSIDFSAGNSSLEDLISLNIVRRQGHWWNDTASVGDGGMANDVTMRDFYAACKIRSMNDLSEYDRHIALQSSEVSAPSGTFSEQRTEISGEMDSISSSESEEKSCPTRRCSSEELTHVLYNPATSSGMCGFRVLQQFKALEKSTVHVRVVRLPRRLLIMKAIKEINLHQKAKSTGNFFDTFEASEEELGYFDTAVRSASLDQVNVESGWSATNKKQILTTIDAASGGSIRSGEEGVINIKRSVRNQILSHPEMDGLFSLPSQIRNANICIVRTANVRRLQLINTMRYACRHNYEDLLLPTLLIVDGRIIKPADAGHRAPNTSRGVMFTRVEPGLELCWHNAAEATLSFLNSTVSTCANSVDPLYERSAEETGSIRSILDKAVVIVFGTPSRLDLRYLLHDLSVVMANSIGHSTGIHVRLMSDLEYRDEIHQNKITNRLGNDENIIFVGGPDSNKVLRDINDSVEFSSELNARLPLSFLKHRIGFSVGLHQFDTAEQGVVFSFPISRRDKFDDKFADIRNDGSDNRGNIVPVRPSLGLCISANSVPGYLHISRIFWRNSLQANYGPFLSTMPDFIVLSREIWVAGFTTGTKMLGYWNASWAFDKTQTIGSSMQV